MNMRFEFRCHFQAVEVISIAYAPILTKKISSNNIHGHRQFDIN